MDPKLETLVDGLAFAEGPRWHEGRLFFSDMHAEQVLAADLDGKIEPICTVTAKPSGLGWLPDGTMLVVSMTDRRVLRVDRAGAQSTHADLSGLATGYCNDMVVDARGRAYVGNFGFDHFGGAAARKAALVLVTPEGAARVAAGGLSFPNGTVITPDAETLVVGESYGAQLSAFRIAEDGSLSDRRVWAKLEGAVPDGICLDEEGAIWVASPIGHQVLRVLEGGSVTHRIPVENEAFACMLGGPERRTLLVCTAASSDPGTCIESRSGRIEAAEVDVPGAGWP